MTQDKWTRSNRYRRNAHEFNTMSANAAKKTVLSRNSFNDDILNDKRVHGVIKGKTREINRMFDKHGDWELFCRAVDTMGRFYADNGSQIAYRDSILEAAKIASTLNEKSTLKDALNCGVDIVMLDGTVYIPFVIAWAAIVYHKGGVYYDCYLMYQDNPSCCQILKIAFLHFENLLDDCYNDIATFKLGKEETHQ